MAFLSIFRRRDKRPFRAGDVAWPDRNVERASSKGDGGGRVEERTKETGACLPFALERMEM